MLHPEHLFSCLQTLQSHYVPAVSELVRKMLDPETANSKIETELDKYLDVDFQEVNIVVKKWCTCNVDNNFLAAV